MREKETQTERRRGEGQVLPKDKNKTKIDKFARFIVFESQKLRFTVKCCY